MSLLKHVNRGSLLNPFEQFYILQSHYHHNKLIPEQNKGTKGNVSAYIWPSYYLTPEGNLDPYACLPAYLPHFITVKTLRPTGYSSYCCVVRLSFCVPYFYFMTSLFHFSYFNTGYNHHHTCSNCNEQIFYNLNYFYNLKLLCFSVHKSVYYKPHTDVLTTVLLHIGENKMVKPMFWVIFVNNQLDAQFFFMYVYFYSLHVSCSHVPIIRRINCINMTSGICHSVYMTV